MYRQYEFKSKKLPYLLVAPQMIIVVIFFFLPAWQAVIQSFYIQDPFGGRMIFVGLDNYKNLFIDPSVGYFDSFLVSLWFSVSITFVVMIISLFLAVQVNKKIKGQLLYKTMLTWPYAVSTLVSGVVWLFMFNPHVGIIAWILKDKFNIEWQYLLNFYQAFFMITLAASWRQLAYNFVFFLAGLHSIPDALIEAAIVDGASHFQRFWNIVFPLLSPTTFYLLVMNMVYGFFETFPVIHQMTAGGPGKSTSILVYKVWRDGVINLDLGSSSAQSVLLMIIVVVFTFFQFRFLERQVNY